jgi:hypothetical protein
MVQADDGVLHKSDTAAAWLIVRGKQRDLQAAMQELRQGRG